MSRDDYISKLFIDNQDKLEQAPSDDFWSKLETQLDAELPVVAKQRPSANIFRLSRFIAAASVLLLVVGSVYMLEVMKMNKNDNYAEYEMVLDEPIALLIEPEPYENPEVVPTSAEEENREERAQEEKIVAMVNEKAKEAKILVVDNKPAKIELGKIDIKDKGAKLEDEGSSLILIEPEPQADPAIVARNTSMYQNNVPVQEQKLNYNMVNPMTNSLENNRAVEEVLNKSKEDAKASKPTARAADINAGDTRANRGGGRSQIMKKSKSKSEKYKSPMAAAHPRLQQFGFLLGRWVDNNETEGKSYETWSLKNSTTLAGKGYKLSSTGERVFEEMMRIEFRDNQVFLVMSLDENNQTIDYMLTKFDNEEFIFSQSISNKYPDNVLIQKSMDGYSTIIVNNGDFLTTDQIRYLENRNRVSNVRSIRTLRYE